MKLTPIALSLVALMPAGAALADDITCHGPQAQWQPQEAALALATQNGWTVREFDIDDGCYELEGRDSEGRMFEALLDPATLQIVELEYRRLGQTGLPAALAPTGPAGGSVTPPAPGN